MKVVAIIPARYDSTRFPGKALALLQGKPLIQWVWEAVLASGLFSDVIIATDSELILRAAASFGALGVSTNRYHRSGTDRVAEVVKYLDCDIIVNVQGDEPLINREALSALLECFEDPKTQMASLMTRFKDTKDIKNPNAVKVVCDTKGKALYFSRSVVPYDRDGLDNITYYRHIGVYAFRRETVLRFVSLPMGLLEQAEKLEQLRALEHGIPIRMVETEYQGIGVDTPEDLKMVEAFMADKVKE
jgi:3-deoxy-manno-octulosonate cytidylyltransferase (CMP-KDO synthetase)